MPVFNFEDGNGEVPASIHKNPEGDAGGWVADTATVDSSAYLSESSTVFGKACVTDRSTVTGISKVFGSAYVCGNAHITGNSSISDFCRISKDASISESSLTGHVKVGGNCAIEKSILTDSVEVFGEAYILRSRLCGLLLIGGLTEIKDCTAKGLPLWTRLSDSGKFIGTIDKFMPIHLSGLCSWNISISDDMMKIGCQTFKIKDWWQFSDETIDAMNRGDALKWWQENKQIIKTIIDARKDWS